MDKLQSFVYRHPKGCLFAFFMGLWAIAVVIGGVLNDYDHYYPAGAARTWGHHIGYPISVSICCVGIVGLAYLGGLLLKTRFLKK